MAFYNKKAIIFCFMLILSVTNLFSEIIVINDDIFHNNGFIAYVYEERINLRADPSRTGSVLSLLRRGEAVAVVENTGICENIYGVFSNWYKVRYNGQIGYIWGGLLASESMPFRYNGRAYIFLTQRKKTVSSFMPHYIDAELFDTQILCNAESHDREILLKLFTYAEPDINSSNGFTKPYFYFNRGHGLLTDDTYTLYLEVHMYDTFPSQVLLEMFTGIAELSGLSFSDFRQPMMSDLSKSEKNTQIVALDDRSVYSFQFVSSDFNGTNVLPTELWFDGIVEPTAIREIPQIICFRSWTDAEISSHSKTYLFSIRQQNNRSFVIREVLRYDSSSSADGGHGYSTAIMTPIDDNSLDNAIRIVYTDEDSQTEYMHQMFQWNNDRFILKQEIRFVNESPYR